MPWFPQESQGGWRFDLVSLLAIIGESTIEQHVPVISASSFAALPRLLPAPQTVIKTERRPRLPSVKDVVITGVYSGTHWDELNYFADVIHNVAELKAYEFRVYEITYAQRDISEVEKNSPHRAQTSPEGTEERIDVPVKPFCALNIVTLVSVLMTIALFIWAAVIHDGVAMIALVAMSVSTSLACLSSVWYPVLSKRPTVAEVPPGDVVITTRSGAFLVVHCDENITRELYGGAERCQYVYSGRWHRVLLGTSTVLLMASIILFSNCGWTMQAAIGVSYIILNILYWAVPLVMEKKETWDMSRYQVKWHAPNVANTRHPPSYTQTLWYAIQETKSIEWVLSGKLAPSSDAWRQWLGEAKENCDRTNPDWDPVEAKDRLMSQANRALLSSKK